ncbi:hypothetical protein RB2150_05988 [Rhodobacterales bacterium HTCC2150]|nr:hypothetical protein RB2150_05988 [Rhodobacterales bacterium HTCC2150] [Rhodobacteraceae bacterium HTCC2150]
MLQATLIDGVAFDLFPYPMTFDPALWPVSSSSYIGA